MYFSLSATISSSSRTLIPWLAPGCTHHLRCRETISSPSTPPPISRPVCFSSPNPHPSTPALGDLYSTLPQSYQVFFFLCVCIRLWKICVSVSCVVTRVSTVSAPSLSVPNINHTFTATILSLKMDTH